MSFEILKNVLPWLIIIGCATLSVLVFNLGNGQGYQMAFLIVLPLTGLAFIGCFLVPDERIDELVRKDIEENGL